MQEKYLVFTGRPNAGKSSLIKELAGLNIATGKRAGTTRKISHYPLSDGLVLVDLPGLGKMVGVSKRFEEKVNDQIIEFLESNAQNIVLAVTVLDISTFLEVTWRLEKKGFKSVDVEIEANLNEFTNRISDGNPSAVKDNIFQTSTKTGKGLGELKNTIHERLIEKGYKTPFKLKTR